MKIKRFFAKDMRTALNEVKETLGADAVIMSNKKVSGGVEIVAAIEAMSPNEVKKPKELQNTPKSNFAHLINKYQENTLPQNQSKTENPPHSQQDKSESIKHFYQKHQSLETNTFDSSEELHQVQNEMAMIRQLLEHQVSSLLWQESERKAPLQAMLTKKLLQMGIGSSLAEHLSSFINKEKPAQQAWQDLLILLAKQIQILPRNKVDKSAVMALLGPTGVGKTTTIAKLAAQAAMEHGANEIALVTTDTFRIGAFEQLMTYGRILGCPVKVAKDAKALTDILYQLRSKTQIFVDTAGIGQRDSRLSRQLDTLMQSNNVNIQSLLVLSAVSQGSVLQETIKHFQKLPLTGCILTKLDESLSLGPALNAVIEHGLPVGFLTHGQRVPEDITRASRQSILEKANELFVQNKMNEPYFVSTQPAQFKAADFYD